MKKFLFLLFISKFLAGQDIYFDDLFNVTDLRSAEELFYKRDYIDTNFWERQTYWHFDKREICKISGMHKYLTETGFTGDIDDLIDIVKNDPTVMEILLEAAKSRGFKGEIEALRLSLLDLPNSDDCYSDCYKKANYGDVSNSCKSRSGFCEEEKTFFSQFAYNWDSSSKTASTFVTININEKRDNLNCNDNYKLLYSRVGISFDYVNKIHYDSFRREIQNRAKFEKSIRDSGKPSTQYYKYEIDSERHLQFFINNKVDDFYKIQINVVYNSGYFF